MSFAFSGVELLQIRTEMQTRCDSLFQELENNDLITNAPIRDFNAGTFASWLNSDYRIIGNGLHEILANEESIVNENFSHLDFVHFVIYLNAYSFVVQLEQLKDTFVRCLDENKLHIQNNDPLGTVILKINDKLNPLAQTPQANQESSKQRRGERRELFFIDFRNAIAHRRYTVHAEILSYLDKDDNEVNLTAIDFERMKEQFDVLRQHIFNYESNLVFRSQNPSSSQDNTSPNSEP